MNPHPTDSRRGVPVGSWNYGIGVIGDIGCGKSTVALHAAWELSRCAYVFAYDPTWRLPPRLPGGVEVPIKRHGSLGECAREFARDPSGIHAPVTSAERLLGYSLAIARRSKGGRRVPLGTVAVPVVLLLDEAVLVREAAPGRLAGSKFLEAWTGRRHEHVAIIYTAQSPRIVDRTLLGLASALYLFRCDDAAALQRLRDAGCPRATVERLPSLGKYEFVSWAK